MVKFDKKFTLNFVFKVTYQNGLHKDISYQNGYEKKSHKSRTCQLQRSKQTVISPVTTFVWKKIRSNVEDWKLNFLDKRVNWQTHWHQSVRILTRHFFNFFLFRFFFCWWRVVNWHKWVEVLHKSVGRGVTSGVCIMIKGCVALTSIGAVHYIMAFSDFRAVLSGVSLPHVEMALQQKFRHELSF